jgi:hypothetical protein
MIVTAKAGRPDTNRAGNEILRMIAEGKIPWRFLSQDVKASTIDSVNGVWVDIAVTNLTGDHSEVEEVGDEELSEVDSYENQATTKPDATPSESEDSGSEEEALAPQAKSGGMFGALAIDEPGSATDSDEEDDE